MLWTRCTCAIIGEAIIVFVFAIREDRFLELGVPGIFGSNESMTPSNFTSLSPSVVAGMAIFSESSVVVGADAIAATMADVPYFDFDFDFDFVDGDGDGDAFLSLSLTLRIAHVLLIPNFKPSDFLAFEVNMSDSENVADISRMIFLGLALFFGDSFSVLSRHY
ncbi:hypothetical protein ACHAPF_000597 [Botrytis cinerea]